MTAENTNYATFCRFRGAIMRKKVIKVVKMFGVLKIFITFAPQLNKSSGCSAVRLAHLLWEQGVPGSNPGIPTKKRATVKWLLCYIVFGM